MNNLLKQNKIIVVIILAALFQLISFIFSQIVVNLDEELEKTNYKTISNEIKLDDLDMIIRHTLPDLLVLTTNQGLNLKFYRKYYSDTEYNESLTKIVNQLSNYLEYIEKDFFIDENLKMIDLNISNNDIKDFKMLSKKIFDMSEKLEILEKKIINANDNLKIKYDYHKHLRHLINIGLISTQIFNLFFLGLFFLFAFDNYKKPEILVNEK